MSVSMKKDYILDYSTEEVTIRASNNNERYYSNV